MQTQGESNGGLIGKAVSKIKSIKQKKINDIGMDDDELEQNYKKKTPAIFLKSETIGGMEKTPENLDAPQIMQRSFSIKKAPKSPEKDSLMIPTPL